MSTQTTLKPCPFCGSHGVEKIKCDSDGDSSYTVDTTGGDSE